MNLRRTLTAASFAGVLALGLGAVANAQTTTPSLPKKAAGADAKDNPLKCVGAAQAKQAVDLHIQGAQASLGALNARLAAAQQANNTKAAEKIQGNIAKVNERIAKMQERQAQLNQRCP
jgi:hypothetical protein